MKPQNPSSRSDVKWEEARSDPLRHRTQADDSRMHVRPRLSSPRAETEHHERPDASVSWKDLPRKGQLVLITMTRFSEPMVQTSLQVWMAPAPPLHWYHIRPLRLTGGRSLRPKLTHHVSSLIFSTNLNGWTRLFRTRKSLLRPAYSLLASPPRSS